MIGTPPSQRPAIPEDPAEHAAEFGRRYFGWADYVVSQRMIELGIDRNRIGEPDIDNGMVNAAFHSHNRIGGGISPVGQITVDSGLFNPTLMDYLGQEAGQAWAKARAKDRLDAIVAHEYEEHAGGTHEGAMERAAETELPIREKSRSLLRIVAQAEKQRRGQEP